MSYWQTPIEICGQPQGHTSALDLSIKSLKNASSFELLPVKTYKKRHVLENNLRG